MNLLIKTAARNILRNARRSLMTGSAVAAGAVAMMLFGGFANYIFAGLETNSVQRIGHLNVFHPGYFLFGSGNPAAYGIDDYRKVIDLISQDPAIKPLLNVATPTQSLVGIAGNFSGGNEASKTFLGVGLIPSARDRMRRWDEHGTGQTHAADERLSDGDETRGLVGVGLARILGLCGPLNVRQCPAAPARVASKAEAKPREDIVGLAQLDAGHYCFIRRLRDWLGHHGTDHRPPARPSRRPALVGDDSEEPRPHVRTFAKLSELPPGVERGLLDRILGRLMVMQQTTGQAVGLAQQRFEQELKRSLITLFGGIDGSQRGRLGGHSCFSRRPQPANLRQESRTAWGIAKISDVILAPWSV